MKSFLAFSCLAFVVLGFLNGCDGAAESRLEVPVERRLVATDLLAIADTGTEGTATPAGQDTAAKAAAPRLSARLTLPENATLYLKAHISRRDLEGLQVIGPTRFAVTIDGRQIFAKTLLTYKQFQVFEKRLSLRSFAEKTVDLEILIRNRDPEGTHAYWSNLLVEETETVARRPAGRGPNLLLVMVDTLRADRTSLYGYDRKTTPNLEAFATEALVFEHAVAPASWTLPSVASLLTGLYPPRLEVERRGVLSHRFETLAELAQAAGLTTAAISANPVIAPQHGFGQGFEEFHHVPWSVAAEVNELFQSWVDDKAPLQWFAYLHYIDPHDPYAAPEAGGDSGAAGYADPAYDGLFRDPEALNALYFTQNFGLEPAHTYDESDVRFLADRYDEEVRYWDRQFGELIAFLRHRGLLERTIVVVLSDHGEEFVEHAMWKHGHQLYEESIRVPLLIRAPRLAGGRREAPVEIRWVFEAARALMRLGADDATAGEGTAQELLIGGNEPRPVFSHVRYPLNPSYAFDRRTRATVRLGDWKLVYGLENGRLELYDLASDPEERRNLAHHDIATADELKTLIEKWLAAEVAATGRPSSELAPELLEKLRSLGYLQ